MATSNTVLPFPVTENYADAEFLIGSNRPTVAVPERPANGNHAAIVAITECKNGDPKITAYNQTTQTIL